MFDDPWLILGDPMVGSSDDEEQTARLASSANGKVGLFSTQQGWPIQQAARLASSANSRVGLFSSSKVFQSIISWHEARYHCESLGGNLPSIHDNSTNMFIASLVNKRIGYRMWIGLHDTSSKKAFEWSDGTSLDFSSFYTADPYFLAIFKGCVQIYYGTGHWKAETCESVRPYVCSIKPGTSTIPATVFTTPAPFCLGSNWIYHQGFCYFFSDGYKKWLDARADCLSRGGDLASILSEEENSFILSQLKIMKKRGPVWIGYRKFQNNSYA
ncbi:C-type mannose receptor 2 [Bulinus truncatus]|nr:C-type mannose receptor 2 [Bulinus truncatus]